MSKTLSCGILLTNEHQELLLCHVTGASWWDIPKGGQDKGETPLQTAVREMQEETGIVVSPAALHDLGRFSYRADKSLHLFAAFAQKTELNLVACRCTTHFEQAHTKVLLPEVDDFKWVPFTEVPKHCAKSMVNLLARVSLPDIAKQVAGRCCLSK